MRPLLLLAAIVIVCAACADEPAPDATPAGPMWLTDRPENAHPYSDETLARFAKLVGSDGWREAAWNPQGTLEAVHERTGLAVVLIPAGSYLMGSPVTEAGRFEEETQHKVTVPAFLLCKTECTQAAWVRGGGSNPSHFRGDDLPVEQVTWEECRSWCGRLGLRLPSEAEWEYACRAGTATLFSTGHMLTTDQAKYGGGVPRAEGSACEFRQGTVRVGSFPPNSWGLHDMHGNVGEWCQNWRKRASNEAPRARVRRGGNWFTQARFCRSASRSALIPTFELSCLGFRPAADLSE
jgi:formylglycine-generating enzyme required for sulfatase activity